MKPITVIYLLLLLLAARVGLGQTLFSSDFEYAATPDALLEAVNLNGAIDQVGLWSGDDFPEGDAYGLFSGGVDGGDSAGFVVDPRGGTMLFIDRPLDSAVQFMDLTESTTLGGTKFSFTTGIAHTGSNGGADFDLFGLDETGTESFRIRIGADASTQRLGYASGGATVFDLPTSTGVDAAGDLSIAEVPLTVGDSLANVSLTLGEDGYVIDFASLNQSNSWSSNVLPYNGDASELSRIAISYTGQNVDSANQPGFYLDDLIVQEDSDVPEPTPFSGYVDGNGRIVLVGSGEELLGMELRSPQGLLIPAAGTNADPFDFQIVNEPEQVVLGNAGNAVRIEGEVVTAIGYAGTNPETELVATWGNASAVVYPFTINMQGTSLLDCNGDGVVDAGDLSCGCNNESGIDGLLAALNLIKGDLDLDGEVAFGDFLILSGNFGQPADYVGGDLDCDGTVLFGDFLTLSSNFGKSAASSLASVPEPSGMLALLIGAALGFVGARRRRRLV